MRGKVTEEERVIAKLNEMEDLKNVVARRLKYLMTINGIDSLNGLAEKSDINVASISKYINGVSEIRAYNLLKLAETFNVSADYILGVTNSQNKEGASGDIAEITGLDDIAVRSIVTSTVDENYEEYDALNMFLAQGNELKRILRSLDAHHTLMDKAESIAMDVDASLPPESEEYEKLYDEYTLLVKQAEGHKFAAVTALLKMFDDSFEHRYSYQKRKK